MRAALFFEPHILRYSYGPGHPFEVARLADVIRFCSAAGTLPFADSPIAYGPAQREALERFHDPAYLDLLEHAVELPPRELAGRGLATGDNPVFDGLWEACLLTAGGSLAAARWIEEGLRGGEARRAFHPAGGLHHAHRDRASGFCYVNDGVLAIQELTDSGRKVCYVDLDAHHGDGVQEAFYASRRVLTISIHQDGRTLFPGTGFADEVGSGEGLGYALNVPVLPGAADGEYDRFIEEILTPAFERFRPDLLVTEIGVDSLRDDPLAGLNWTLAGLDRFLAWAVGTELPWLALGGGGYRRWNVVRAWGLVWTRMIDGTFPRRRPTRDAMGSLPDAWPMDPWDEPPPRRGAGRDACRAQLRLVATYLAAEALPRITG